MNITKSFFWFLIGTFSTLSSVFFLNKTFSRLFAQFPQKVLLGVAGVYSFVSLILLLIVLLRRRKNKMPYDIVDAHEDIQRIFGILVEAGLIKVERPQAKKPKPRPEPEQEEELPDEEEPQFDDEPEEKPQPKMQQRPQQMQPRRQPEPEDDEDRNIEDELGLPPVPPAKKKRF